MGIYVNYALIRTATDTVFAVFAFEIFPFRDLLFRSLLILNGLVLLALHVDLGCVRRRSLVCCILLRLCYISVSVIEIQCFATPI